MPKSVKRSVGHGRIKGLFEAPGRAIGWIRLGKVRLAEGCSQLKVQLIILNPFSRYH